MSMSDDTADGRSTRETVTRSTCTMGTLHEFHPDEEELSTFEHTLSVLPPGIVLQSPKLPG